MYHKLQCISQIPRHLWTFHEFFINYWYFLQSFCDHNVLVELLDISKLLVSFLRILKFFERYLKFSNVFYNNNTLLKYFAIFFLTYKKFPELPIKKKKFKGSILSKCFLIPSMYFLQFLEVF